MTPQLKRLDIEAFRGFAESQSIDLDASAVVIRGDNGTGKTSVVDGLLWLFTGELAHLAERVRGLRRTEDVVTNRFTPGGSRVTLTVTVDEADRAFTREGTQRVNELTARMPDGHVVDGNDAEVLLAQTFNVRTSSDLQQAVLTWGLLRQDAIRVVLDEAGGALHERVAGLVGLERVSDFAAAATRTAEGLVRERTSIRRSRDNVSRRSQEATSRLEAAQRAAGSRSDVAQFMTDGLERAFGEASGEVSLSTAEPPSLTDVRQLGVAVESILGALTSLQASQRALGEFPQDANELLASAERAVTEAADQTAASTKRAPTVVQLASAAIDLLGETCPVCGQSIDEASVRRHLEEILSDANKVAADARRAQDALVRARSDLVRIREVLERQKRARADVESATEHVREVIGETAALLQIDVRSFDETAASRLQKSLTRVLGALRGLYRDVNEASGAHVTRLAEEAEAATTDLAAAEEAVRGLETRCETAKRVERAAHEAASSILEDTLEALRPSFSEVFDRLAPSPAFTQLVAKQDVLRNRNQIVPMVRDLERGISANPLVVFSEGQLNVVALSYFLGMALNAKEAALPFLVLDDPLQALDVIAILGFGDLCRHIRDHRQLIVTTHDRRFADVLVRKLAPRADGQTLVVHEFEGWVREGPIIQTHRPERAPIIRLLAQRAS